MNGLGALGAMTFSPDGGRIVISPDPVNVEAGVVAYVGDPLEPDGGDVVTLSGPYGGGGISSIPSWSPDGSMIAIATGDGKIHVWDSRSGDELAMTSPDDRFSSVDFDPDSARLDRLDRRVRDCLGAPRPAGRGRS